MSSIEHNLSGAAEHMEARRKEQFKQRQAKARKQMEILMEEKERQRMLEAALYGEQTKQPIAPLTDQERRRTVYQDARWKSAKIPYRYTSFDYMSQW